MDNANLKNDVTIRGAGSEWILRPSFGCLMAIEQRAKKSLLKMIDEFQAANASLTDMIVILKEGSRSAGKAMSDKDIERLIDAEGIVNVQLQLTEFFIQAMYGGKAQESASPKAEAEGSESQPTSIGMSSSASQSLN